MQLLPSKARAALILAAEDLQSVDVGPVFEILQKFGGTTTAPELAQAATKWNYYAPIALASLPNGEGIPSLVQLAQDTEGTSRSSSRFALQLLAEMAPQHLEATQALLDQVRTGKVPDAAWPGIASALEGTRMFYSNSYLDNLPPATGTNPKSYSIAFNRQNFQSYNLSSSWTPEQLQQQISLLDQLRAANPAAAQALEQTRAALTSHLNK